MLLSNQELIRTIEYGSVQSKRNEAWEQLLKQSPSNEDLRYIIRWTDKRNEAWEQLLKQSPSNEDLRYIIEYTDKRNEAWEQLLKQSPSNEDLRYIIRWTDKRNEAWEQLLKQSPSNEDLRYIIRWTDKRNEAGEQLLKQLGVTEKINEEELIKQIAVEVTNRPGSLEMGNWHCGTTHCLAGWATILSPVAQKIEEDHGTETAGCAVLPNYANLFFSDNDTVMELLKSKI